MWLRYSQHKYCFLFCVFILHKEHYLGFSGAKATQIHLDWNNCVGPKSPSTHGCLSVQYNRAVKLVKSG